MKRGTPTKPAQNAFMVLMGSGAKKKQRTNSPKEKGSRFVQCPVGCGKNVAEKDINLHVDECLLAMSKGQESTRDKSATAEISKGSPLEKAQPQTPGGDARQRVEATKDEKESKNSFNTFKYMMKRSTEVFSDTHTAKLAQSFHLNADGSVILTCYSTNTGLPLATDSQWSSSVDLRVKKTPGTDRDASSVPSTTPGSVELSISSAIECSDQRPKLVKFHSRLSIPVLKSILQKSIRRRKPLPAVRVAMELVDRALGELLRRMPIIILEDSTLHPSFPFLVWLMVAHSKQFEPNESLIQKLLRTVYEAASCPWQDHQSHTGAGEDTDFEIPSLDAFHQPGIDTTLEDPDIQIWSMLVRAGYGGMPGDVRMLNAYANVWNRRFKEQLPDFVRSRLVNSKPNSQSHSLDWISLPTQIHAAARQLSASRVDQMTKCGLRALSFSDITTEGVDFHCSRVVDFVLSDPSTNTKLSDALIEAQGMRLIEPATTERDPRTRLESLLKRLIWTFSAGLNRRLPLTSSSEEAKSHDKQLKATWEEHVLPRTKLFAENYVRQRLSRS